MRLFAFLKKILNNEDGFALPAALALLLVGGLLIVPSSAFVQTSLNANRITDDRDKSIYAADAGIEYALWQIDNKIKNPGTSTLQLPSLHQQTSLTFPGTLNGKNLTVTIYNQDGKTFGVNSISSDGIGLALTIISDVDLTFTGGISSSVFDYALASLNGNITLSGNTDVESDEVQEGDIYANGNVSLSGNSKVNGDASAIGTITTSANARITGTKTTGAPPLPSPSIDTASYENETLLDINYWGPVVPPSGSVIDGVYHYNGPVHVAGNLNISYIGTVIFPDKVCVDAPYSIIIGSNSTVIFNGPVKVGGQISISGNNNITFGSTVHVGGNFTTSGNAVINLGGTVYVEGAISMTGNSASFNGGHTVIAEGSIILTGNSQLPAEQIPFIMSTTGAITLAGNAWTSAVMYAPNGTITLSGNSRLYGSAVGQSITGSGNSKITYPTDLRNQDDLPGTVTSPLVPTSMTIRTYSIQ